MLNQFEKSFKSGLLELLYLDPNLGAIARGLGMPVIDNTISTAGLRWDKREKKIVFAVNEEFLENSDEEMIASVILHETEHLIFDHVSERIEDFFPDKKILHMAQECINNDIIDTIYQLPLPDDAITGRELLHKDCTSMSTKQVYDLLVQQLPPQEGEGDGDSESQKGQKGPKGQGGKDQPGGNNGESDDGDSESQKGQKGPKGQGGGQPGGNNGESDDDEGNGEGDESDDKDDQKQQSKGGCGGIQVDDEDVFDVEDYLKDLVDKTAKEKNMTADELMDEINNTKGGGYSPTGEKIGEHRAPSPTRMNWNQLLAKINPKVLEAGKKTKVKYDWTKQNRRMISVYPQAIIPKIKTKDPKASDKGDSLPVLVIALDLSGSIPSSLVKMLQGLLEDIPGKLIKAYPCTWGSNLYPYVPGGILGSGGTDIDNVSEYVQKIKDETKTNPYVLVITDGEFYYDFKRPGKDWYFMAIDDSSYKGYCKTHAKDEDHLYHVRDFKV
jgi:predicted metal-dependent peptidase